MKLSVHTIINNPIPSNCYVVYDRNFGKNCVIIDPGSEDISEIIEFCTRSELNPEYVILTHEHFDHIWGVDQLRNCYSELKVICNLACSEAIGHRKKNLSVFFNQKGFELLAADIILSNKTSSLICCDHDFLFIITEGHSEGSLCLYTENILFSGDTLIFETKTVTKIKGGNKIKLHESLDYLQLLFKQSNPIVYPGHGEKFAFNDYSVSQ